MESGELIARFLATTVQLNKLRGELFEHARQQERLEQRFNELQWITRDLVNFLLDSPDRITAEWVAQRNMLVVRAQPFLVEKESKEGNGRR
jgi:hypothetical protein